PGLVPWTRQDRFDRRACPGRRPLNAGLSNRPRFLGHCDTSSHCDYFGLPCVSQSSCSLGSAHSGERRVAAFESAKRRAVDYLSPSPLTRILSLHGQPQKIPFVFADPIEQVRIGRAKCIALEGRKNRGWNLTPLRGCTLSASVPRLTPGAAL